MRKNRFPFLFYVPRFVAGNKKRHIPAADPRGTWKPTTPKAETCQDAQVRTLTRLTSADVVEVSMFPQDHTEKKRQNPPIPFLREGADDNIDFQLRDCKRRTKKTFPFLLHVACFAAGNKKRHIPAAV